MAKNLLPETCTFFPLCTSFLCQIECRPKLQGLIGRLRFLRASIDLLSAMFVEQVLNLH